MPGPIPIPIIPSLSELEEVRKRVSDSMSKAEQIEALGQVVDKIDNYLTYAGNKFAPLPMQVDALSSGLKDVRADVMSVYMRLGGEDIWPPPEGVL